uniref:Uncharacterized protein n=1 Tax=uncultured marine virus TaxID=186617 RepID=S4TF29_9VIRU|nr:hypothetical protein [uncultured marine virus]
MAEIAKLQFSATGTSEKYFDLSSALTAANRKQYHQVGRNGKPLLYHVSVEHYQGATPGDQVSWTTAPCNWTIKNAVTKMSAAWKHQLKEAGIRMRDLSKYGRRLRLAFDDGMSTHGNGNMANVLPPLGRKASDGTAVELFETYKTAADDSVSYESANEFTRIAVPDAAGGDSVEMNLALMGFSDSVGDNNYFGVVDEYLGSRGGVPDETDSAQQTPDADNLLQTLFSSTQPSTDEVIEAVEDYQDFRPYMDGEGTSTSATDASNLPDITQFQGNTNGPFAPDTSGASVLTGPGQHLSFYAPLGLIKISGMDNKDSFAITVNAITEM